MKRSIRTFAAAASVAAACFLAGCGGAKKAEREKIGPSPETFRAEFSTTKGKFVVLVHRAWAPHGADRFYELVKLHYYDGNYFFRVLPNFIVQWGINGNPSVAKDWSNLSIPDDPFSISNKKGTVTFATSGPQSRTTQLFVNLNDNKMLDPQGFTPFGEVSEGMNVVETFYSGYGEGAPRGRGPDQATLTDLGNSYLEEHFSRLDHITKVTILE